MGLRDRNVESRRRAGRQNARFLSRREADRPEPRGWEAWLALSARVRRIVIC